MLLSLGWAERCLRSDNWKPVSLSSQRDMEGLTSEPRPSVGHGPELLAPALHHGHLSRVEPLLPQVSDGQRVTGAPEVPKLDFISHGFASRKV